MSKQRLLDILVTALISAAIAFLQSMLMHLTTLPNVTADPALAAGIGGILSAGKFYGKTA